MIVKCPCGKARMSNRAKTCPSCGIALDGGSEQLDKQLARQRKRRRIARQSHALAAMFLMVLGVAWMWWRTAGISRGPDLMDLAPFVLGAVWYAVARVLGVMEVRRTRKQDE